MAGVYCDCKGETYPTHGTYYLRLLELFKGGGVSLGHFSFILKATGAVVSGSTILDALQNKALNDPVSDVDIFVEEKNAALLNALIYPLFVKYDNPPDPHMRDHTGPGYMSNIVGLYNYTWRSSNGTLSLYKRVQVIVIKNGIAPKEHVQQFDLTFCQNYFDGDHFYSFHPRCVHSKTGSCGVTIDYDRLDRLNKYIERGYTITNFDKKALDKEEATRKEIVKKYRELKKDLKEYKADIPMLVQTYNDMITKIDYDHRVGVIQHNSIDYYTQLKLLNCEAKYELEEFLEMLKGV